jgi:uncharacterized membrane protein (DUF373 family)
MSDSTPKKKGSYKEKVYTFFGEFENVITMALSVIIGLMIIMSLVRVTQQFYLLFVADFIEPQQITFKDYQDLFGKILTLLISLEFLSSILKVLKSHEVTILVQDVILITALAIARKLIVYDYDHHDSMSIFALASLLISIGVFYFLIRHKAGDKSLKE